MARRRMFSNEVTDSDLFLDLPLSTQALYFHYGLKADDDGFVASPNKIQRLIGCSIDDNKLLIAKGFIIPFESGIIVITHWHIHNYLQNDRYKDTIHLEEKSQLILSENKSYLLMYPNCIHNGYNLDTQNRQEQTRQGKFSNLSVCTRTREDESKKSKPHLTRQDLETARQNPLWKWALIVAKKKKNIRTTPEKCAAGIIYNWLDSGYQTVNDLISTGQISQSDVDNMPSFDLEEIIEYSMNNIPKY